MMHYSKNLFAIFLLSCLITICGCLKNEDPVPTGKITVNIGSILSLTGNWSTLGTASKSAMEIAIAEVNEELAQGEFPIELKLSVYDSRLEPSLAASLYTQALEKGDHFIIGPQSSSELAAIKPLADASPSALIISQGSTAGTLAIANDVIYRFCPSDRLEGADMAKSIHQRGIRALVTLCRNDDGNKGLYKATGEAFTALGGVVGQIPPYGETVSDFSETLTALKIKASEYVATYGAQNVGVYLASFDECTELFKQASSDALLSELKWFGSDGVAHSAALIGDPAAAAFAEKTAYFAPSFGLPPAQENKWKPLTTEIKTATGIDADAFALAAYDAVWVIAKTVRALAESSNYIDLSLLQKTFEAQAAAYTGATGSTTLDEFGDRAIGAFDYWAVRKTSGGSYEWVLKTESN